MGPGLLGLVEQLRAKLGDMGHFDDSLDITKQSSAPAVDYSKMLEEH